MGRKATGLGVNAWVKLSILLNKMLSRNKKE
jgi:hypothetical protein